MSFLASSVAAAGAVGAAAGIAAAVLPRKLFGNDPHRPPMIYDYFCDSIWYEESDFYDEKPNAPLKGSQKADIVIVGGGLAGLSSAWQLIQRHPNKRIVLLEGAVCGYGSSGRNAGHALTGMHGLTTIYKKEGGDVARRYWDATKDGFDLIKKLVEDHGVDCNLEETGKIGFATMDRHVKVLEGYKTFFDDIGLESEFWDQSQTQSYMKSKNFIAAWKDHHGGHLNPAKLTRGMKRVVEELGVEVYEHTLATRVTPGQDVHIETEFGEIVAPKAVLCTNAYGPSIGILKHSTIVLTVGGMATEPLTDEQLASLGWANRESCWDMRAVTASYFKLTADNRIAYCGDLFPLFYGNELHTGVYKPSTDAMMETLFKRVFPQLEGVKITHQWTGSGAMTADFFPNFGVAGPHKNVIYNCCFNGEGVVMSQIGGIISADLHDGVEGDYSFMKFINRKPMYAGHEPLRYPLFKSYFAALDKFGSNVLM